MTKLNDVEPFRCLSDILERTSAGHPAMTCNVVSGSMQNTKTNIGAPVEKALARNGLRSLIGICTGS
jgi:hypothetical protein